MLARVSSDAENHGALPHGTEFNMNSRRFAHVRWSRGEQVLRDPALNKDAAFTGAERKRLGLEGLLPPHVLTLEQQVAMELEHIFSKEDPLEQYIGLVALLDRNETLFYRLLIENLERLAPIVYTPTVGLACQKFSHIFRRPRGLFICPGDRGHIAARLRNYSHHHVRLIVVTDNERILGLGDQGAGGMAIPVGKLILYSAGAGIHPSFCLPVSLDVGTDNRALLDDPFYLGHRGRRLRGAEYDSLIEEFVRAVKAVFPHALLQWEDFKKANAFRLFERYRERLPSFNDDIQGTAGVTLAGVLAGLKLTGRRLRDERFLFVGAGAAGVGTGALLTTALKQAGLAANEARQRQLFMDSRGIVHVGRSDLEKHKHGVAWSGEAVAAAGFREPLPTALDQVIEIFKPSVLIGTTGQPGDFTPAAMRTMATHCERPLIFPLSNPTSKAECTPAQALEHSDGRALVATGSPFEPVTLNGRTHVIGQCNNAFVFPGVGLGVLISEASRVSDSLFLAAANTLAEFNVAQESWNGALYPSLRHLRQISQAIGIKVAQTARDEGFGRALEDQELKRAIEEFVWFPDYPAQTEARKKSAKSAA
jgi:malic enzyme